MPNKHLTFKLSSWHPHLLANLLWSQSPWCQLTAIPSFLFPRPKTVESSLTHPFSAPHIQTSILKNRSFFRTSTATHPGHQHLSPDYCSSFLTALPVSAFGTYGYPSTSMYLFKPNLEHVASLVEPPMAPKAISVAYRALHGLAPFLCLLCSSHMGLLAVPPTLQACLPGGFLLDLLSPLPRMLFPLMSRWPVSSPPQTPPPGGLPRPPHLKLKLPSLPFPPCLSLQASSLSNMVYNLFNCLTYGLSSMRI